jgi:mannose-6-phosphate isomerase-like protein (cupin superfamily)
MDALSRDERPWGFYEILHQEPGIQIKRITVTAGNRFSLQTHEHRAEHWFITAGDGYVTKNGWVHHVMPGRVVVIEKGDQHRAQAAKDNDLVFLEVQVGSYLGEDDIVRLEDDYGR